jgi:hypothetical protein
MSNSIDNPLRPMRQVPRRQLQPTHSPQTAPRPVVPNYPAQPPQQDFRKSWDGAAITAYSLLNRRPQNQNRPNLCDSK